MPTESLKIFLTKLIDYAGLFPPANLELEPALKKYRKYIECDDNWIISQFIIPVNKLENINENLMELFDENYPLNLSLLSGNLSLDKDKIKLFENQHLQKIKLSGLETKIIDINNLDNLLESTIKTQKDHFFNLATFFELPYCDNWIANMKSVVNSLSEFNNENNLKYGFKLRCGGIKADMFPKIELIANAILECIKYNIPMKFTAGLHHPIRHYNDSVQNKMNGFFNIFLGGMIAKKYELDSNELVEILMDESAENFKFEIDSFIWKNFNLTNKEIEQFHEENFISYGSCSFNEPREDLTNLGIF